MKNINIKELFNLTKNLQVLYVEDDIAFNKQTKDVLEDFFYSVDSCFNGIDALDRYKEYHNKHKQHYDIVISDINMPKMDGISLTKEIYKINKDQKVIIVSAYNETEYFVELINIGVERFLQKPFKQDNLLEILYNIFNKNLTTTKQDIKLAAELIWDNKNYRLTHNSNEIKLTKKELELLKLFIKNGSKISTTQEIFNIVWDDDSSIATTDALKALVSRLRKKLPDVDIETFYNIGYRLNF